MTSSKEIQAIQARYAHLTGTLAPFRRLTRDENRSVGCLLASETELLTQGVNHTRAVVDQLEHDLAHLHHQPAWNAPVTQIRLLGRLLDLFLAYTNEHIDAVNDFSDSKRRNQLLKHGTFRSAEASLYKVADHIIERATILGGEIDVAAEQSSARRASLSLELPATTKRGPRLSRERTRDHETRTPRPSVPAGTSPTSRILTACAVYFLPSRDKSRYQEEFASELYALRSMPRRTQVIYSFRLVLRTYHLRRALSELPPAATAREHQ